MAKRFFYISMGVLALALAYHLGATTAGARSDGGAAQVLVARAVQIVDEEGNRRATFGVSGDTVVLALLAKDRTPLLALSHSETGGYIVIQDATGQSTFSAP